MEKNDIQNKKNFFILKMESRYNNKYKKKQKKLFRQKSDISKLNNTSRLKKKNYPYLINSNSKINFNENTIIDIRKGKQISPIKKLQYIGSYKSKNNNNNSNNRPHSNSYRKLPKINHILINDKLNTNSYLNLDTEKINQEKDQLGKLIKNLKKELFLIKKENKEKDEILNTKEKEINDIISMTNSSFGDNGYNLPQNYNFNSVTNENKNIYLEANMLQNNPSFNLYLKIKKEIKNFNNEIKEERQKIDMLKHSVMYTKIKEINVEYNTLEEQINKISSLINNALSIKENNYKKLKEISDFEYNINIKNNLLNELRQRLKDLNEEKIHLEKDIKNMEYNLIVKKDKVNINKRKLNSLIEKNKRLSNDQVIKIQDYKKIENKDVSLKSIYISKISKLQKLSNSYKNQFKYNELIINKLKEKKKQLIENINLNKNIKYDNLFLMLKKNNNKKKNNKDDKNKSEENSNKNKINIISDKDRLEIDQLRMEYKSIKNYEKKIEEKYKEYLEKINQINENNNQQIIDNENLGNENVQNQLEFGIDKNNPYYTENEDNKPEINNKFTSTQFNQFTYILFKNFEAKDIVSDEAINKIINPFIKILEDNKLNLVEYPSDKFEFITEEYTKIILNSLNSENNYNHILTKNFVGALLINSGCCVQKLIEFFYTLYNYTKSYIDEEDKFISKLRNKYQEEIRKLYLCINNFLEKEQKEKKFEQFPIYFPLLKIKELIIENDIHIKDKYIEFLFYYLKKNSDNKEKLDELKYTLLNNIIINKDNNTNNENNINYNKVYEKSNFNENILEKINNIDNNMKENIITNDIKEKNNNINNDKEMNTNNDEKKEKYSNNDENITEITNEEYINQINDAIRLIKNGLNKKNLSFDELIKNIKKNVQVENNNIDCFSINDFNEKLKEIDVILSDLKLSCLCNKFSLPNELELINIKNFEEYMNSN